MALLPGGVGERVDDDVARPFRVGHPRLLAPDDEAARPLRRGDLRVRGVGPAARLGQAEADHGAAGGDVRQQRPLLRLGAEQLDGLAAERRGRAGRDRDGMAVVPEREAHQDELELAAALSAPLGLDREAEEAELRHPGDDRVGQQDVAPLPPEKLGSDLGLGEAGYVLVEREPFFVEKLFEIRIDAPLHGSSCSARGKERHVTGAALYPQGTRVGSCRSRRRWSSSRDATCRPNWTAPRTEAETSGYTRTSTSAQVDAFVAACAGAVAAAPAVTIGSRPKRKPIAARRSRPTRPSRPWRSARRDPRLKVLVMANIHAGEVEGKEAVQVFLREIAQGLHARSSTGRRGLRPELQPRRQRRDRPEATGPTRQGPVEGVGVRHNGGGLDLNRDYVKVEAPETEALIRTVRAIDAALVVDLHTTNGSFHGFDLTYAGPLHPATDPGSSGSTRDDFLPELQDRMRRAGFETFDYGNWVDESRPAAGWETFEARPRFGNSYFGLCNRLTLLSEAYSHDPFEKRIRATHALVREALELFADREAPIRKELAEAEARTAEAVLVRSDAADRGEARADRAEPPDPGRRRARGEGSGDGPRPPVGHGRLDAGRDAGLRLVRRDRPPGGLRGLDRSAARARSSCASSRSTASRARSRTASGRRQSRASSSSRSGAPSVRSRVTT